MMPNPLASEIAERSWSYPIALFKNCVGYTWHKVDTDQYRKALRRKGTELIGVYSKALVEHVAEDLEF